jgi:serine/threonine protein kinase
MGTVVAARDRELNREVALKVLSGAASLDPESVERFHRESEAVARLDHPGIVRLYERGEAGGLHFYAMELVKGTSLDTFMRRERVAYLEAARIVAQCAHAMDFAHAQGVLHRDLKPANILLDPSGRARVTDFGLARIDRKATLTTEGTVVGTPLYLAPELAIGDRATRRSDIYSLGATLYELATGKPPYPGKDARTVMMRVLNEAPIPPDESDPRIPKDLVRIIGKAMARSPEERYPNARSLAVDLERFAQGRSLEINKTAAFKESSAAALGRKIAVNGAIVLGVVAVLLLLVYLDTQRKRLESKNQELEGKLKRAKLAGPAELALDQKIDREGILASKDRDIRARTALKSLTADATDESSKRSVEEMVARAKETADNPTLAGSALRQALAITPHRWDLHLELARAIATTDVDEAENELTMCIVSTETTRELQLAARLERGRLSRSRGDPVSLWLAAVDLKLVRGADAVPEPLRVPVAADLAFALASTGEVASGEKILNELPTATGDEVARVALARAAVAKANNDSVGIETELAHAREAASSDETRRLVDTFPR